MSKVINQLQEITAFCHARSIEPQAIEACEHLGAHVRVSPDDFDRLRMSDVTQTIFGGGNPWLLRIGHIGSLEIRSHQSIEAELANTALGDRTYITARSFNDRFASNLTATIELAAVNKEVHHA